MTPTSERLYFATRAQIARAAALSANDDCARIAHETLARAYDVRALSDQSADPEVRAPAAPLLRFPLRSIPKWVPVEA